MPQIEGEEFEILFTVYKLDRGWVCLLNGSDEDATQCACSTVDDLLKTIGEHVRGKQEMLQ